MRLCSYVVATDKGFAPNPFGGVCTLAACTPNHQGLRLEEGDWVLGNSGLNKEQRLIYAMRISEVLDFDAYFKDPRYQHKKPTAETWEARCGDNIYFRDEEGDWKQARAFYHTEPGRLLQDTRHPRVFISDHFYYFGEKAPAMPADFGPLIRAGRGCRCEDPPEIVSAFVSWVESTYSPGLLGLPRDREDEGCGKGCPPPDDPDPDCAASKPAIC